MVIHKSSYGPKHIGLTMMMGMVLGIIPELTIQTEAQALPWFRERQTTSEQSSDSPPNTSGQSAGSRGCLFTDADYSRDTGIEALYPLKILNAHESVQYTTLEYPTFAWIMGFSTHQPIEFRLYQYDDQGENIDLLYETNLIDDQSSAGVKLFSLPQFLSPLSLEGKYIWQVEVVCDPDRPSSNFFVEAEVDRIETPTNLHYSLQGSSDLGEKIEILGNENLWLDALSLAIQTSETGEQLKPQLEQLAIALNEEYLYTVLENFKPHLYITTPDNP